MWFRWRKVVPPEELKNPSGPSLAEALDMDAKFELGCVTCGARQPIYIRRMIEKHGPDTPLEIGVKRLDCPLCGTKGRFNTFIYWRYV
jgi:hypothetical protein